LRLNHVTLVVQDVERSAAFYRVLGLTQLVESYPRYARFLAPDGDATLSLEQGAAGTDHTASIHFEVDDVDGTVAELEGRGLVFAQQPADQTYLWREAVLLDPDGHRVFVYHAGVNRIDPPWRLPEP
jgi:catechol 2,3-dioxygenase-like lactoylglutathione lyase family enzyme